MSTYRATGWVTDLNLFWREGEVYNISGFDSGGGDHHVRDTCNPCEDAPAHAVLNAIIKFSTFRVSKGYMLALDKITILK